MPPGISICGASAIVAINSVTQADDEDVAYALACVTFCGTIAMFAFPLVIHIADLDSYHYGLWTGAAIHEVGQVVAAAFQGGQVAGEFGTIAKLTRVVMLAPLIFMLAMASRRNGTQPSIRSRQGPPVPIFIMLFLVIEVSRLKVALEFSSNEAVRTAVENGAGATIISELVVASQLASGALVASDLLQPVREFKLVHHRDRLPSPTIEAFMAQLPACPEIPNVD